MSSSGTIETTLSKSQRGTVEANRSKFNDLNPPEEEWVADELPDYLRTGFFKTLERRKLIETVGHKSVEGSRVKVWRTKKEVWNFLQKLKSRDKGGDRDRLLNPCGHMGFTNLMDKPFYECNTCGAHFVKSDDPDQKFDWPDANESPDASESTDSNAPVSAD